MSWTREGPVAFLQNAKRVCDEFPSHVAAHCVQKVAAKLFFMPGQVDYFIDSHTT
jgi:hypothetical protein